MSYHTRVDEFLRGTEFQQWAPEVAQVRALVEEIMRFVYAPSQIVIVESSSKQERPNLFPLQVFLDGAAGNVAFTFDENRRQLAIGFGYGRGITAVKIFTPLS